MKAELQIALIAILLTGCAAESRFTNDPRAAVVGPAYLDYIEEFPRDLDTQYYYPVLTVRDGLPQTPAANLPSALPPEVDRLMMTRPHAAPLVQATEGKGWPELEQRGIPLFWDTAPAPPQVAPQSVPPPQ
jgi:hypothetical protein